MKFRLYYNSNNSGGSWWLTDENWLALEKAGWDVQWVRDEKDAPKSGRFLNGLASRCSKVFVAVSELDVEGSAKVAIREFEKVAEQNASDGGCECCGPPHSFSYSVDIEDLAKPDLYDAENECDVNPEY